MKKNIVRKDLVVGIIALFIGLAFIPSFNAVSMSKTSDDTTPPVIEVTWETSKFNSTWYVKFDCEIYDNESGIDRAIFYLNGVEQEVYTGPGPFSGFHFTIELSIAKKCVFKFEAINGVGLSAFVEVDGSDIKSNDDCGCQSKGKTHLAEKLLNKLEKNEVLSNVIYSDNPKEDPPICDYILESFWHYVDLMDYYGDESHKYQNGSFMYRYYKLLCYMCFYTSFIYLCSAMLLDCDMGPYYP